MPGISLVAWIHFSRFRIIIPPEIRKQIRKTFIQYFEWESYVAVGSVFKKTRQSFLPSWPFNLKGNATTVCSLLSLLDHFFNYLDGQKSKACLFAHNVLCLRLDVVCKNYLFDGGCSEGHRSFLPVGPKQANHFPSFATFKGSVLRDCNERFTGLLVIS